VAYSAQTPWLPNGKVRDVITCGADYELLWYRAVIEACALDIDMQTWPHADETRVGDRGITMSGGQKHRLVCPNPLRNHRIARQ
jgi:ATP-binding cassette, subfamily C (CFTR/MRP), member 1